MRPEARVVREVKVVKTPGGYEALDLLEQTT